MDFKEFRVEAVNARGKKTYDVTNSFGVYDAYKLLRKDGWPNIGRPLQEHEFYVIIRSVNKLLAENLVNGEKVCFPCNMGKLDLRKFERTVDIVNGVLKIRYPVDWNNTIKLWFEDEEARENKTLVRFEDKYTYRIWYDKFDATYENKVFYRFTPHMKVRRALKDNIKNGTVDTLW